ncbi:MAG: hypothetical protein JW810_08170 [Sedimentisphaerales bacterium]|nr:hypothetical protein [Sedimentisphaerales bacterium]
MKTTILTTVFALLALLAGCNRQNQATVPAAGDEGAALESVTVLESAEPSAGVAPRDWPERTVSYAPVGLKHPALYLEGPYEKKGSNDGYFKTWDRDSAISLAASPVIFVGKVIAWPVRLVQTPPWKMQVSRSGYPVQQPVSALPAEPSRSACQE